jgi:parallel beta-helix repeat protein
MRPLLGTTLYVGGSGPGNYSSIQEAIDDANDNDTVFVFHGVYHEHLIVEKSISLVGESRTSTIVDRPGAGNNVVFIDSDGVTVTGFTLKNSTTLGLAGIFAKSNDNLLYDNIIENNQEAGVKIDDRCHGNIIRDNIIIGGDMKTECGVLLRYFGSRNMVINNTISGCKDGVLCNCNNNVISGNVFVDNSIGVGIAASSNITVENNRIKNNSHGIAIENSIRCLVKGNSITDSFNGLWFGGGSHHTIMRNTMEHCDIGIYTGIPTECDIVENNFMKNKRHALFFGLFNTWDRNYWGRPRLLPKPLFGWIGFFGLIPFVIFDWHPAQEPYDITETTNLGPFCMNG